MRKANKLRLIIGSISLLLLSLVAAETLSWYWILGSFLLLFLIVGTVPICRRRESMWLFVLTALGSMPINIKISTMDTVQYLLDSEIPIVGAVIATIEIYLLLFSVEEILIGIIGRFIWKRQIVLKP